MPEKSTGFRPNLLFKILKSFGQTCQVCHMYAFRSGRVGLGSFGPILGVGRLGPVLLGHFGPLYFT